MPREVPEWIGKHPDQAIPPRVRARVFERYNGICYLSKRKIMAGDKWEIEHVIAIINGGEHRENNMAPALADKHRDKTRDDMALKAKIHRTRNKHIGIAKPKTRGFDKRFTKGFDGIVRPRG